MRAEPDVSMQYPAQLDNKNEHGCHVSEKDDNPRGLP